jgi:hypothetical protein
MSGASLPIQGLVLLAMAGIVFFAVRHYWLLAWNIREYLLYRKTEAFKKLRRTNGEVKLMGLPLTLAMTINTSFAAGAALVPGLWNIVEYLFPVAIAAFAIVGAVAMSHFIRYISGVISIGSFDCSRNNNWTQLKAVLTFGLVGVGISAPAAMSLNTVTVTVSLITGLFFTTIAIIFGIILLLLGFRSMMEHGIAKESAVSLWIPLPIFTVIAVAFIRQLRGLAFLFDIPADAANVVALRSNAFPQAMLVLTTVVFGLQILFAIFGYAVMHRVGYFKSYVNGNENSVDSYALICPGTALFVFGMFFIHMGLVRTGLLTKFSVTYFVMLVPLIASQLFAIRTMMQLDRKLMKYNPPISTLDAGATVTS